MKIVVRWIDGYVQVLDYVTEWRAGAYLLWVQFTSGSTRHIPLSQVRWFEPIPSDRDYMYSLVFDVKEEEA